MMLEAEFDSDIDISRARAPIEAFNDFAEFAPAGAKAIYWRGTYLANYTLAEYARKLQSSGLCELVQRRVTAGRKTEFEYIAIKRRTA
ncbi:hypothetical protein [uncultured Lentibacter sp.]|uniref:hypothetical protein n=1 Tax=uncultured Lentibacter sp. TaxID=1659309 RepID=UPI0026252127|nr:hypothetical protein [uncultured Lentibacter sp.]